MKEIKANINEWKENPCSWTWGVNIVINMMLVLGNLIYITPNLNHNPDKALCGDQQADSKHKALESFLKYQWLPAVWWEKRR